MAVNSARDASHDAKKDVPTPSKLEAGLAAPLTSCQDEIAEDNKPSSVRYNSASTTACGSSTADCQDSKSIKSESDASQKRERSGSVVERFLSFTWPKKASVEHEAHVEPSQIDSSDEVAPDRVLNHTEEAAELIRRFVGIEGSSERVQQ